MCCIDCVAQLHVPTSERARAIAAKLSAAMEKEKTEKQRNHTTTTTTTTTTGHLIDRTRIQTIATYQTKAKQQHHDAPVVESAYLCTGLDVYVTLEPSPMDAMALLHSRVTRVFYNTPDPISGVLGSNGMLHEAKTINHRYKVYCLQPILVDESKETAGSGGEEGRNGKTKRKKNTNEQKDDQEGGFEKKRSKILET